MGGGHAVKNVGEPGLRLDPVQFAGLEERGHGGPAPTAPIGAGEEVVLASECDGADGSLDRVGIEFDAAIIVDFHSEVSLVFHREVSHL